MMYFSKRNIWSASAAPSSPLDFLSQVVERGPEKAGVGGSIPSLATTFSTTYTSVSPRFHSNSFQLAREGFACLEARTDHLPRFHLPLTAFCNGTPYSLMRLWRLILICLSWVWIALIARLAEAYECLTRKAQFRHAAFHPPAPPFLL
jgi:hypothetical protein